jgi:hypothetical protein
MYLDPWMIGMMFIWWLLSVYGIAKREQRTSFDIGLALGITATIDYIKPSRVPSHDQIREHLIEILENQEV